jgi:hypothetical protein
MTTKYEIAYLSGRCVNGANGSKGTLYHAVKGDVALCGRIYGRRSAGWYYEGDAVTCPKCLKKIAKGTK